MTPVRAEAERLSAKERRLRFTTYAAAALVVLGLVPALFALRAASEDPVYAGLDRLAVPDWAAGAVTDAAHGNRWCVGECRTRERTWTSARDLAQTRDALAAALAAEGWEPVRLTGCPPTGEVVGAYECWTRDEYVLDMWVRPLPCDAVDLAARDLCTGATATVVVRDRVADPRPAETYAERARR